MKRFLALLLVCIMCISVCACDESEPETETVEQKVAEAVKNQVTANVSLQYSIQGVPSVTTYVTKVDETTYEVSGKVTVHDAYGETYSGSYDATVTYDSATDDCDVDLDLGSLYRSR